MRVHGFKAGTRRHGALARRSGLVLGVVAMLLAADTAVIATSASAQAKAGPSRGPLPSEPVARRLPQPPIGDLSNPPPHPSQLDKVAPPAKPSSFDPARSTVLAAETTATRKVFANPDGSRTAQVSAGPVRFADSAGWHDIDLSLVPGADGTLAARSAQTNSRLGATGAATASIDTPAGPIGLRHPDGRPVPAVVDRATASYAGAVGGRDLSLALSTTGVSETVTVGDRAAGPTYRDELVLPAGVTARQAGPDVEFVDGAGSVVATFTAAQAHDANKTTGAMTPVLVHLVGVADQATTSTAPSAPGAPAITAPAPSTVPAPSSTVAPATTAPSTTAPTTTSTTAVAKPTGPAVKVATVEVGVDPAWFADASRVFPVTIDPFVNGFVVNGATTASFDTWISSGNPTTSYATNPYLAVGTADGGATVNRALFWFDLGSIPAWAYVSHAALGVVNWYANSGCTMKEVNLRGVSTAAGVASPSAATTWSSEPLMDAVAPTTASFAHNAPGTACFPPYEYIDATGLARRWVTNGEANHGLELRASSETDSASFKWLYSADSGSTVAPVLSVDYNATPSVAQPVSPADGSTVPTARPTLVVNKATDPGDTVKYWFRASPAADAESGAHVVESGWILPDPASCNPVNSDQVCYTVPEGELVDGVTYHWHVWTYDGTWWRYPDTWAWSFTTNLGLGDQPSQPHDTLGPATVNLTNGNLMVSAASPGYPTVGGGMGLSYTYNSAAPSTSVGLIGKYYDATGVSQPPGEPAPQTLAMVRLDPAVSHWWEGASPGPGLGAENFFVRWSGYLTMPTGAGGSYYIGAQADDGVRVTVGGTLANGVVTGGTTMYNRWADNTDTNLANPFSATTKAFTENVPVPIQIDYYQHLGASAVALVQRKLGDTNYYNVDASSLSPGPNPELPTGWTLSVGGGAGATPASARPTEAGVSITDGSGAAHRFSSTGSGYSATPGEQGILASGPGGLTLHSGGAGALGFGADGGVSFASSGTDDTSPASACFVRSVNPLGSGASRLRVLVDPVSGQRITLSYGGDGILPVAAQPPCTSTATTVAACPGTAAPASSPLLATACAPSPTPTVARPSCPTSAPEPPGPSWPGSRIRAGRSPTSATAVGASTRSARPWPTTGRWPGTTPPGPTSATPAP